MLASRCLASLGSRMQKDGGHVASEPQTRLSYCTLPREPTKCEIRFDIIVEMKGAWKDRCLHMRDGFLQRERSN
jgi:hypothetical protein